MTPGTILEDNMLDAKSNNYLVAAVVGDPVAGIGIVDVSTGEFLTTELDGDRRVEKLLDEIMRLEPAEILIPEEADEAFAEACRTPRQPAAQAHAAPAPDRGHAGTIRRPARAAREALGARAPPQKNRS